MRLKKAQKEKVLEIIAAGVKKDEINKGKAVIFSPLLF
jgi:hypothetical protein